MFKNIYIPLDQPLSRFWYSWIQGKDPSGVHSLLLLHKLCLGGLMLLQWCVHGWEGENKQEPKHLQKGHIKHLIYISMATADISAFQPSCALAATAKSCQYLKNIFIILYCSSSSHIFHTRDAKKHFPEWDSISTKSNWNKQRHVRNKKKCDQRGSDYWQDRLTGRSFQMARATRKAHKENTSEGCLLLETHEEGRRRLQSLEKKLKKDFCQLGQ